MSRLSNHILELLAQSECVIVPGVGALICRQEPSRCQEMDNPPATLFLSPGFRLVFNPQITENDGLLQNQYSRMERVDFPSAYRVMQEDIDELIREIQKKGQCRMDHLGLFRSSVTGVLSFLPEDGPVFKHDYFGLSDLELKTLEVLEAERRECLASSDKRAPGLGRRIRHRSYRLRPMAAAAVLVLLIAGAVLTVFPGGLAGAGQLARAFLLPEALSEAVHAPWVEASTGTSPHTDALETASESETASELDRTLSEAPMDSIPSAMVTESSAPDAASPEKRKDFHVIVASFVRETEAQKVLAQLQQDGYERACILVADGRARVAIQSFTTLREAVAEMQRVRRGGGHDDAWVLKLAL